MLEYNTNLIVGKIASGKTKGILLKETKNLIKENGNILLLDNKLEYYNTYAKELKQSGYNVLIYNLQNSSKTNSWNPLMLPYMFYKDNKKDIAVDLIKDLSLEIFKSNSKYSDPYWENTASDFFTGLVLTLFKEGDLSEINLGSIGMMASLGEKKLGDTTVLSKYIETLDILDNSYIAMSPTVHAPNETRGSILSVVKQKLNTYLMREQLLNSLCTDEINLYNLKEKTAIFVIGKLNEESALTNILIDQTAFISAQKKLKTVFMLDNFDTLNNLSSLENLVTNATYYGFKVYVATRDISELEEKYNKYILKQFLNVYNVDKELELVNIIEYGEYPKLNMTKHNYFNIEEFVKSNIK